MKSNTVGQPERITEDVVMQALAVAIFGTPGSVEHRAAMAVLDARHAPSEPKVKRVKPKPIIRR